MSKPGSAALGEQVHPRQVSVSLLAKQTPVFIACLLYQEQQPEK